MTKRRFVDHALREGDLDRVGCIASAELPARPGSGSSKRTRQTTSAKQCPGTGSVAPAGDLTDGRSRSRMSGSGSAATRAPRLRGAVANRSTLTPRLRRPEHSDATRQRPVLAQPEHQLLAGTEIAEGAAYKRRPTSRSSARKARVAAGCRSSPREPRPGLQRAPRPAV